MGYDSAAAFPMPEVPLTKTATRGFVEKCTKTAFEALVAVRGLIVTGWLDLDTFGSMNSSGTLGYCLAGFPQGSF